MCNSILKNITIMNQSIIIHLITLNLINLIYLKFKKLTNLKTKLLYSSEINWIRAYNIMVLTTNFDLSKFVTIGLHIPYKK